MADSFTDFIQNLFPSIGQTQQPMLTGTFADPAGFRASDAAAAYYADPFRKQNAINQASLDAALKQKQADEAAQRVQGMISGGDAAETPALNDYVAAFLDAETDTEKGARLGAFGKGALGMLTGFPTGANLATMLGLNSTAGMQGQLAAQYQNYLTQPSVVQNIMSSVAPGRVADARTAYINSQAFANELAAAREQARVQESAAYLRATGQPLPGESSSSYTSEPTGDLNASNDYGFGFDPEAGLGGYNP